MNIRSTQIIRLVFSRPALFLCATVLTLVTSCASKRTEKVKDRQAGLTDYYTDRQALRQTRTGARQERTDAWFDRSMGKPVGGNSNTGLKLP
jgi:hypothetical protein